MRRSILSMLAAAWCLSAGAVTIERALPDAAQEAAARELFHDLKCVVCEGQSLGESDAALAVQMRQHIRDMLAKGATPDEVRDYFRLRYGDSIVMTPPLGARTLALWAAPLLMLLLGGACVWRLTRHERSEHE